MTMFDLDTLALIDAALQRLMRSPTPVGGK